MTTAFVDLRPPWAHSTAAVDPAALEARAPGAMPIRGGRAQHCVAASAHPLDSAAPSRAND